MKVIVTESQLRNIVKRQKNKRKMEKDVEEAASLTSPSTTNQSIPSSSTSTSSSSSSSGGDGSVINIPERPDGVPEMGIWKSNMVRSVGNPAGESVKSWSSYDTAQPKRGQANKLK